MVRPHPTPVSANGAVMDSVEWYFVQVAIVAEDGNVYVIQNMLNFLPTFYNWCTCVKYFGAIFLSSTETLVNQAFDIKG